MRLIGPAMALWAGTWVATSGRTGWVLIASAAVGVAGLVLLLRRRRGPQQILWSAVTVCLVAGLVIGAVHATAATTGPVAAAGRDTMAATVEVTVDTAPLRWGPSGPGDGEEQPPGGWWARGTVRQIETRHGAHRVRSPVLLIIPDDVAHGWDDVALGARVRVAARAGEPDPGSELSAVLRTTGPPIPVAPPGPALTWVGNVRDGLREAVAVLPERPRALVPALVLGDTSAITDDMERDFLISGTLHLLAVSGSNLTLLLAFLLGAAKMCGVRGRWLYAVTGAGVVVFVMLCRTDPSVLRAAAMGTVGLVGLVAGSEQRDKGIRSCAVAMLGLLLVAPWLARSFGFALSVVATLAIVWWAGPWAERLGRWLPRWAAEAISVPLAAQIATTPIAAMLSGQVSLVGLVANVVAGPFVGPATVAGFLTAAASQIWMPMAQLLARPAGWAAHAIVLIARWSADSPGAHLLWPTSPAGIGALTLVSVATAVIVPHILTRHWLSISTCVVLVIILMRGATPPGYPPRDWVVAACDVGQGNAVVVPVGQGAAVLVDTGPPDAGVSGCLQRLGVTQVPLLILSHLHADHAGALPEVLASVPVDTVVIPEGPVPQTGSVPVVTSRAGDVIRISAGEGSTVTWETLAPAGAAAHSAVDSVDNDRSLLGRVSVNDTTILLTGDLEREGQQSIRRAGAELSADVLVVPHHGSGSQDPAFLTATGASVAVISVGRDNTYGHPHPDTLAVLEEAGMRVVRTDEIGDVVITGR